MHHEIKTTKIIITIKIMMETIIIAQVFGFLGSDLYSITILVAVIK